MKVVEAFSGIGSQAKALQKNGFDYEIIATVDWDINAIIAYDLIHHGKQDLSQYEGISKSQLLKELEGYTLSPDGKAAYKNNGLARNSVEVLKRLHYAIKRSNNLVSITDIKGEDLPDDVDMFTYSFPCQDLSIAGVWHGNMSGIDRDAKNRSGMLWEVERILKERVALKRSLPKFLLMENVSNILSSRHKDNFNEWVQYLASIGYHNKVYRLNAKNFGIPQTRERVYMLSVFRGNDLQKEMALTTYFEEYDLENATYSKSIVNSSKTVKDLLKTDYSVEKYRIEADMSQPNDTPSRTKIMVQNDTLFDGEVYTDLVKTITTKQDRNPNSGVVLYDNGIEGKAKYRTLTPRECFLFMGFEEKDYDIVVENDFMINGTKNFFTQSKLIKMAGNSIVVNVLEAIFKQVKEIDEKILSR